MSTCVTTMTSETATGDMVATSYSPTTLFECLPVATIGSVVTGSVCVGAVTSSCMPTTLYDFLPVADLTADVVGVNPETGVPVTTAMAISVPVNYLI